MKVLRALAAVAVLSAAALGAGPVVSAPSKAPAALAGGTYRLDKRHTSLTVRVLHMGFSWFTLRFDGIAGTLEVPQDNVAGAALDVTVDPASVNTGLPDFDKEIAARAFDAPAHPVIRFVSRAVTVTGADTGTVTGDLTFHGMTRPVTLDVTFNGAAPAFGKSRAGFSATGSFKRSDFGADAFSSYAGDEVRLLIEAEFSQ